MIAANGALVPPTPDARPLAAGGGALPVTIENPPGLYGTEEGVLRAQPSRARTQRFAPLVRPQIAAPVTEMRYALDESRDLKGPLVAAALLLMVLDTLAVFWMGGLFSRRPRRAAPRWQRTAAAIADRARRCSAYRRTRAARRIQSPATPRPSRRSPRPASPMSSPAMPAIDSISRAGLDRPDALPDRKDGAGARRAGRRRHRQGRAGLLPDHLLADRSERRHALRSRDRPHRRLYAAGRHRAVRHARPVRDRHRRRFGQPGDQRLRDILGNLNVPPLEPVPEDHVLTKSFFILPRVSRPLQRQPALGRGLARRHERRQPAGAHRRRRRRRS